jgi:hypothetical protein
MSRNRPAILPDVTHYEMAVSPELVPTIMPFLNGQTHGVNGVGEVERAV